MWKGFQDAINSELVSVYGNFINRSLVLMHKLCSGKVPPYHAAIEDSEDIAVKEAISRVGCAYDCYGSRWACRWHGCQSPV